MLRRTLVCLFGVLAFAAFGMAGAQNAFTSRSMNVRAGPNRGYPLVAQLGAGTPLDVHGCLSDWSWCDLSFDDSRGWIYAGGVSFVYRGERVPLYTYAPSLGLPIITFSLLTYWNDYYRARPWYPQRNTWAHRRLPPHLRPRGKPRAGPPPVPRAGRAGGGRPAVREERHGHTAPSERGARSAPAHRAGPARGAQPQPHTRRPQPQVRPKSGGTPGRNERRGGRGHNGPR